MNFIQQIERLQKLNKLVEQESTGSPEELARRLGIRRRTLYDMIESLKSLGIEIRYNRKIKTFCYENENRVDIRFSFSILKKGEIEKISGGKKVFSFRAFFPHGAKLDSLYRR